MQKMHVCRTAFRPPEAKHTILNMASENGQKPLSGTWEFKCSSIFIRPSYKFPDAPLLFWA